jgi:hypothetical protein
MTAAGTSKTFSLTVAQGARRRRRLLRAIHSSSIDSMDPDVLSAGTRSDLLVGELAALAVLEQLSVTVSEPVHTHVRQPSQAQAQGSMAVTISVRAICFRWAIHAHHACSRV